MATTSEALTKKSRKQRWASQPKKNTYLAKPATEILLQIINFCFLFNGLCHCQSPVRKVIIGLSLRPEKQFDPEKAPQTEKHLSAMFVSSSRNVACEYSLMSLKFTMQRVESTLIMLSIQSRVRCPKSLSRKLWNQFFFSIWSSASSRGACIAPLPECKQTAKGCLE